MSTTTLPLVDHLRSVTWHRHETFEKLPFVVAMTNGTLPLESYIGQLRGLAAILSTVEHAVAESQSPVIERLKPILKSRFKMLCADLEFFAATSVPDVVPAIRLALDFARQIRTEATTDPDRLLGYLYVLEGTTRGNQVHLPDIVRCFNLEDEQGVSFYRGYGDATESHWEEFRAVMNDADSSARGAAEQGTVDIYKALELFHEALYPFSSEHIGITASSLNPEAGDHPVPQSRDELNAAIKAGQQCRDEFSYYGKHYGERGQKFTNSDVAWLAALSGQSVEIVSNQVLWLGRVLSSRGMPLLLLERQVQLLVENLQQLKGTVSVEALQAVATEMYNQRCSIITQDNFDKLCAVLSHAIPSATGIEFPDLPHILVGSQIDRIAGMPECRALLMSWLEETSVLTKDELNRVLALLDSSLLFDRS